MTFFLITANTVAFGIVKPHCVHDLAFLRTRNTSHVRAWNPQCTSSKCDCPTFTHLHVSLCIREYCMQNSALEWNATLWLECMVSTNLGHVPSVTWTWDRCWLCDSSCLPASKHRPSPAVLEYLPLQWFFIVSLPFCSLKRLSYGVIWPLVPGSEESLGGRTHSV